MLRVPRRSTATNTRCTNQPDKKYRARLVAARETRTSRARLRATHPRNTRWISTAALREACSRRRKSKQEDEVSRDI